MSIAFEPDILTMEIAPLESGVEIAAIVFVLFLIIEDIIIQVK